MALETEPPINKNLEPIQIPLFVIEAQPSPRIVQLPIGPRINLERRRQAFLRRHLFRRR